MKLFIAIILIAVVAGIAEWFAPWWVITIVAAVIAFVMKLRPGRGFVGGLLGIGILWLGFALWRDIPNDHILSERLAKLFRLPGYAGFIFVTTIVGGLVGGLSAWAGTHLRLFFREEAK